MKTIQIPLELAEEILLDARCTAKIMYDEWNSGKGSHEEYLPESYHKLKKLVDEELHKPNEESNIIHDMKEDKKYRLVGTKWTLIDED